MGKTERLGLVRKEGSWAGLAEGTKIPCDAYLIIIGAMKCGTSSLFSYLAAHLSICPCVTKEPEFFSQYQRHRRQGVAAYEDLWTFDPNVHRYALEASTGYTKYPSERDVPKRMHSYGINPKFIYVVRNPYDRILSQYRHYLMWLPEFHPSTPLSADDFVHLSDYYLQLEQYRRYFPRNSFLILDFDELRSAPQAALEKVYGFLDIPPGPCAPASYKVHNAAPSMAEVLVARSRSLQLATRCLPRPVRHWGARIVSRMMKQKNFTAAERNQIHKQLADSMRRFRQEYGFDVRKWGWQ
jgi:hypothetical protein